MGEQKTKTRAIMRCMPSRCRVSYADRHGLLHAIDVEAESLFEAVAIAVASFREDEVSPPEIDGMTEFTVAVYRNPTEHKIRLGQVHQWARSSTTESPAAIIKRNRVLQLLEK
jgi:hypothetical protein